MDKKDTLPAEIADYVQEAYKSTARMLALVSDLLSVARIEQNRVQDIPVKTNLVPIILAAADEMKPLAIQEKVKIKSEQLKKKTVEAVIDPKLFREVIQNLLSNAVKYSPAGVVTLTIEPKAKDVVIGVADTGVGIPIEDQPNLFSKFFRASNVTTTNTEGSGLGLFVVKSYVDSWGGKIWFVSEAEKGTTFYVSIPYAPRVKSKTK
jgi:signal transduction histidine kinase